LNIKAKILEDTVKEVKDTEKVYRITPDWKAW